MRDVLRTLELEHPAIAGWILDERAAIREHINVFVNERAGGHGARWRRPRPRTPLDQRRLGSHDRASRRHEEGPVRAPGRPWSPFEIAARAFAGEPVEFAIRDPRSGRYLAAVTSAFYGPKVFVTDDPRASGSRRRGSSPGGRRAGAEAALVDRPRRGGRVALRGRRPGCPSRAATAARPGSSTCRSGEQPTRPEWNPGAGGMCPHSIATWPGDLSRLALGISAVGVWLSDDAGKTWRHGNDGLVARYVPEESREGTLTLCVHNMRTATRRARSACSCSSTVACTARTTPERPGSTSGPNTGLPSDFGFPLVIDPEDPDSAYVIPLTADLDRVTPDGRVRVYETRDAGASWTARGDGLPGGRVPDDPAAGVRRRGRGRGHGPLLRRHVGRRLRQRGRGERRGSRRRRSSRRCTRSASPDPRFPRRLTRTLLARPTYRRHTECSTRARARGGSPAERPVRVCEEGWDDPHVGRD